ncbi:MAG: ABC transporter ATP-binding protein [Parachlamydiaceae bacterium]|nr:ABC transporter ATP-binding protein [Parachlamydiaceae bacterium]
MMTIECKGISKYYGKGENRFQALKDVNLKLFAGQLTLLVGPSGSGKTTLLSILHTILTPDEGDLFILGHHVSEMNEKEKAQFRSENMGVIFQALYLIPSLSVLENTILPLIIKKEHEEGAKKKGIEILKKLNLGKKIYSAPKELSRGQQQRVAIARALITDPKIIMCDEPTSALDEKAGLEFMTILRDHALQSNQTVVVVTHDHRIFPFGDRIININDGLVKENNE